MLKKLSDAFVKRVIRNRKLNKEAYSVFVNLVESLDSSITVSEDLSKTLRLTFKYDQQEGSNYF